MKPLNEGIQNDVPLLKLETEDQDLIAHINKSIESARPSYEKIQKRAKQNKNYWLGEQLDLSKLKAHQAKVVNNIVFRDMETMLPIVTQNTPLPKIISSSKSFDKSMQKVLKNRWEVNDQMLDKNRKAVRANFIELLGVMKYRLDKDIGDFCFDFVKGENIMIDPDAVDIDTIGFVAEFINEFTVQEVLDKYPSKKLELMTDLGIRETDTNKLGAKLRYVEFNTPEFTVWKCNNTVLDKQKNPNWDWGNAQVVDQMGQTKSVGYNLWKKPRVPYIFFQTFNLGDQMYANTSFIEQSLKLQDGINKRKRQISDNADEANGILVGSGSAISKEEFSKIDDEPKLKIWLGEGNQRWSDAVGRIPGNQLPSYVYTDMLHSESAVDDLWGIHSITRGAQSGDSTATQDVLQQKQDYGRIDDIVKAYEDFNEQYYQACFQMMLVHYTEPHVFSFEDEDDLEISRDSIIKEYSKTVKRKSSDILGQTEEVQEGDFRPPIIMVKRGSTLPTDDTTRRNEALELAKMQKISDLDLYEKLDYPNAKEMAYRAFLQASNPAALYPEMSQGTQDQGSAGAMQDYQAISQDQETPPNPEVSNPQTAQAHIQAHSQMMDTPEFQQLDPKIQQLFINHVKAEIQTAKQVIGGANGQVDPNAQQAQAA